jgi:hypothetical protein
MRGAVLALALVGCTAEAPEVTNPPGDLQVGVARVAMPAPVGIGTVGFRGFGLPSELSPFSDIYPATHTIHGHPEFKIVAVSRGEGHEVVFVRSDTIGVFQQLRQSILEQVQERTGRDLDDGLIFAATHTHSGPGRIIDAGGPFDLIADTFLPEHYDRFAAAVADGVVAALDDLAPGRIGHAEVQIPDAHSDRRCEDGLDYKNSTVPLLVVEQEGDVAAVVMAYAIHGTLLNIEELTLSQDVSGAIEQAVEDRFDVPVEALMFNSWGADMAPSDPEITLDSGVALPGNYQRMEAIGTVVADAVEIGLMNITWEDTPVIAAQTHRFPISMESLGYTGDDEDLFDYEFGGVYCGANRESDCDASTTQDDLADACIGFPEEFPAPAQTLFTAGQIGTTHFVTFPGEPGTLLAEAVLEQMETYDGVEQTLFFGYGQDYTGYSILSEDWYQGGYEASGALWGPFQGDTFRDDAIEAYRRFRSPSRVEQLIEFPPLPGFETDYTPRVPTTATALGTALVDVPASVTTLETIEFTVAGTDPWLGTPIATLMTASGEPVLRPNGVAVSSDDYTFWTTLAPSPSYRESLNASERSFAWTFHLPASRAVPGWLDLLGSYKLSVEIPMVDGSQTVESGVFEVTATD